MTVAIPSSHGYQRCYHIPSGPTTTNAKHHSRTPSGPVKRLCTHKLIIARKQHPAGRGPSATATSPASAIIHAAAIPLTNGPVQLPPAPISAIPLIAAHHALPTPPFGGSGLQAQSVPLGVNATDAAAAAPTTELAALPDISATISNNMALAAPVAPSPVAAASLPTTGVDASTGSMLDAQSIQAQVEALIQSTSSSVVATNTDSHAPLAQSLALAPSAPIPTAAAAAPVNTQNAVLGAIDASGNAVLTSAGSSLPATIISNAAPSIDAPLALSTSFQNTFAQYQFPQDHDRALKQAVLATTSAVTETAAPVKKEADGAPVMTREEERAADALIADIDAPDATAAADAQPAKPEPFSGADLAAAAKAIGIEADADLLGGTSEDQRALAAAIRRLGDEHGEAAQKAIQQAAAAAAAAAAARASQELARAAAREQGAALDASTNSHNIAGPSRPASSASPASKPRSGPVKRFPCPKCDKAFARAYNLNTHLSTHDPDPNRAKPFACPYPSCKSEGGRSFSRKHDLQRHVASIHENEAEPGIHGDPEEVVGGDTGGLVSLGLGTPGKKFRCGSCGRSFVRRDACHRHQCDDRDSPSGGRTSRSPMGTPYASSVSPRPSASQSLFGGGGGTPVDVALGRSTAASSPSYGGGGSGTVSRGSPSVSVKHGGAGGRHASSLSKEVQAVAKQLQARVEAQSPGPQGHGGTAPHQRPPLPGGGGAVAAGERRNFPLSAISLYASTGPSSMHSNSSSSSGGNKAQIAK
ncbi:conserved hypothetical protein [Sporisorium reilianum SRZ2]|uniref:C2H2-type domain-containing protein n=1 Tax=Sporisorium reilianum (strain SRZ2) TaxID=999809 RepID=E7A3A2_SPORE|nr:conserved hypothetical protein [Sporisorium reilianum SRZ2]